MKRTVGLAVVVAVRLWASWTSRVPQVVADETAYLAMARYLAGGPHWNLGESAAYMPLYSVLVAPAEVIGLSPDGVYRWAVVTNVVLAGLTFLAVEAITRRATDLSPGASTVAAASATSLPALVLSTRFAWSDNLAPLLFALIVLTGLRLLEAPNRKTTAVFAACGVAGYFAHSRFLTVMVVMAATIVVLAVRRQIGRRLAAVAVTAMAVGVVTADLAVEHLMSELNMSGREASEFSRLLQVDDLVISILGQLWYLTVTTGGVAFVGGLALLTAGWRNWRMGVDGSATCRLRGGELALIIGLVGISFATSAGFMTDRPRPDHLVYGRYNDMFVAILVAVGLGAMHTAWTRRRAAVAAALALGVTGLTAQLLWSQRLDILTGSFMPGTIMGLFALDPLATQRIRSIALVAAVVIVVVAALSFISHTVEQPWIALAGCSVILALALVRAHTTYEERYVQPDPSGVEAVRAVLADAGHAGDEPIVCAMTAGCPLLNFYRYQFYLPGREVDLTWDESWRSADVLFAGKEGGDADLLVELGYDRAWADPSSHGALWLR